MFIGHFGLGFGAKTAQPRVSLGTLFLAAQFADLLWPTLLLLGVERVAIQPGITLMTPLNFEHYPVSHSLLLQLVWGALLGLIYGLLRRNWRGALLVAALVPSHWLLDLFMHRPDLPLFPGDSPLLGLGLWNHPVAAQLLEAVVFFGGLRLYLRHTTARNKAGVYVLGGLVAFLLLIQVGNLLGPAPTDVDALAWAGQLQWLIVLLGYWADRNRTARAVAPAAVAGR